MTTGNFVNWAGDISQIGPIYPFVGSEWLLFVVCLIFWAGWHILQIKSERKKLRDAKTGASNLADAVQKRDDNCC